MTFFSKSNFNIRETPIPAVVIPIYRLPLRPEEEISLFQLEKHLGDYPRVIFGPSSLGSANLSKYGSSVSIWPDHHFSSVEAYSRLLMNEEFYQEFTAWSHILIYQLDCLVFRDELMEWSKKPWDYYGAPWFKNFRGENRDGGLWAVGNGGLSLRRISAFLKVLQYPASEGIYRSPYLNPHHGLLPDEVDTLESKRGSLFFLLPPWERWRMTQPEWTVGQEVQRYMYNEDAFWSFEALKFVPEFRVAPVEEAFQFAFEMNPSWCYEKNGGNLPFGCHAWCRYERAFWEKFLAY